MLQPKVSAQAGAHCATQYTWNALPLHPAKPPQLPPTNCSGNFLSAVFPTRCEKLQGMEKEGEVFKQILTVFSSILQTFLQVSPFLSTVIHKRKKILGRVRYRGRLPCSSAVMKIVTDRDTYPFLISKYFTYFWGNAFSI